ncbi:phosphatase PAP2 family protein [Streptosporangium sp. NPDC006013]|uniref:phosphatase PAP2 family protein n=1 Tax=Streptosporangium sp. NPDC006013 TaxID=3155596 RepID=UPI0033AA4BBC
MTEVFAPAHFVIGLPLTVGAVTDSWIGLGWGALAAGLCGGIPLGVILTGVRSGRFGDKHITDRSQRPWLIGVIVALVLTALALLVVLGAPHVMVACVTIMLATLAVTGPITFWWKISFHTAVAAGSVVMLAWLLPPVPVYVAGSMLVAAIAWSRVVIRDHTPAQTAAGAIAGGAATWLTLAILF